MRKYSLLMRASWIVGAKHPSGKRNTYEIKRREKQVHVEAGSFDAVMKKMMEHVQEFQSGLPTPHWHPFSWQNEGPKVSVTLQQVVSCNQRDRLHARSKEEHS